MNRIYRPARIRAGLFADIQIACGLMADLCIMKTEKDRKHRIRPEERGADETGHCNRGSGFGGSVTVPVDEQIIYNQLDTNPDAVWSLLPGAGRLMPTVSR